MHLALNRTGVTKLDYAILQASGNPTQKFGSIAITLHDVEPGESLVIFHHPMGQPKRMTRFRCLALKEQAAGPTLRHRCDTLPGSSGSLDGSYPFAEAQVSDPTHGLES